MGNKDASVLLEQSEREAREKLNVFLVSNRRSAWEKVTQDFKPRPGDINGVFVDSAAEKAERIYLNLWEGELPMPAPWPGQTEVQVTACLAEDLASGDERAQAFPSGYEAIAPLMKPGMVWLSWRYTRPGSDKGACYDGLVKVGGRWIWLLRANRVLQRLAR